MDESILMNRMWNVFQEMDQYRNMMLLYGGRLNFGDEGVIPIVDEDVKNINPRQSIEALMKSYQSALRLIELCEVYESATFPKSKRAQEGVHTYKGCSNVIIKDGESVVRRYVNGLPETLSE